MTDGVVGITGLRAVSVPVDDQERALGFFTESLGFAVRRDADLPTGGRWIELAPTDDAGPVVTLEPAPAGVVRGQVLVRFTTDDAETTRSALVAKGVDVDEMLRWPGVPAMFAFRDLDGNAFSVTEVSGG